MTSVKFVEKRKAHWAELDQKLKAKDKTTEMWLQIAKLYRGLCTDISLAHDYRLPAEDISYLNHLATRCYAALYHRQFLRRWNIKDWFLKVPYLMHRNIYVRMAMAIFWIPFLVSGVLGFTNPTFAEELLGAEAMAFYEGMYSDEARRGSLSEGAGATSFYIYHNVSIGLQCFGSGAFLGVGSLFTLLFNAIFLGVVFGFMLAGPYAANFGSFVMAHGPFELTGICLAGASGLQVGFALIDTKGRSRLASLREEALTTMPMIAFASLLIFLAAFIEGFISASGVGNIAKMVVMFATAFMLLVYLNIPRIFKEKPQWT